MSQEIPKRTIALPIGKILQGIARGRILQMPREILKFTILRMISFANPLRTLQINAKILPVIEN